jgi:hypothetical protein
MDDEILGELNEIVALANAGNRLTSGLQLEVDGVFTQKHKYSKWKAPKRSKKAKSASKPTTRKSRTGAGQVKAAARP